MNAIDAFLDEAGPPKPALSDDEAIAFIAKNEGFRDRAYRDLRVGSPVIGYGTLLDEARKPGIRKLITDLGYDFDALASGKAAISEDDAARIAKAELPEFRRMVESRFGVNLPPNKMLALLDLAYQSGGSFLRPRLIKAVGEGDDRAAADYLRNAYVRDMPDAPGIPARAQRRADLFAGIAPSAQAAEIRSAPEVSADRSAPSAIDAFLDEAGEPRSDMMRKLGIVGEGLATGLANAAGMPVDIFNIIGRLDDQARRSLAYLLGMKKAAAVENPTEIPWGGAETFKGLAKEAGIIGNPENIPQTTGEKFLSKAAEGAGAMLPFGAVGGIGSAVKAAIAGAGAGVGSEAGGRAAKTAAKLVGAEESPVANFAGEIGGAIAGGAMASGLVNSIAKIANYVRPPSSGVLADYRAEGVQPRIAGDVSGGENARRFQNALKDMPGSAGVIKKAAQDTIDDLDRAVKRRAAGYGSSETAEQMGHVIKGAATGWRDRFRTRAQALYDEVDRFIKPTSQVEMPNTVKALTELSDAMPGMESTAKALLSDKFRALQKAVTDDLAKSGNVVPYASLKRLRSEIGQSLNDGAIWNDQSRAELLKLYGALSDDMKQAVTQYGGADGLKAFNRANKYFRDGMEYLNQRLSNILKDGKTAEDAFNYAMAKSRSGGSRLRALRDGFTDDEWNEVAAAVLNRMGMATANNQNAAGTAFSPGTFLTNWNALSPGAKRALFADTDTGELPEALNRLARIAQSMKDTQQLSNVSRTSGTLHFMNVIGLGGGGVGGALGYSAGMQLGGPMAAGAGAVVGGVAGNVGAPWFAAKLMTNPAFVRWLATPVGEAGIPAHLRRLSAIAAANPQIKDAIRAYVDRVGAELDTLSRPKDASPLEPQ